MPTVSDIIRKIENIAPLRLAESWDPVGLQVGDPASEVEAVMLCLDITPAAIARARAHRANMIITHHPLIFSPLSTVRTDKPGQQLVHDLIRQQISVYSAHTNLDAAYGGVADCLAKALELETEKWQIVFPGEKNNPQDDLDKNPSGHGRFADLYQPVKFSWLRKRVIEKLGSSGCRINTDLDPMVSRVAVFPGSFSEEWTEDLEILDIDTVITGEAKHHVGLELAQRGITLLDAGHDVTERVVLQPLADKLQNEFSQITFAVDAGLDYNKVAF